MFVYSVFLLLLLCVYLYMCPVVPTEDESLKDEELQAIYGAVEVSASVVRYVLHIVTSGFPSC